MKTAAFFTTIFATAFLFYSGTSTAQTANSLSEAARIQKQAALQDQNRLNTEELKEQTKKNLNSVLQSLSFVIMVKSKNLV